MNAESRIVANKVHPFETLGEQMSQGGKQGPHEVPHTLSKQMSQPGGYKHGKPEGTLGKLMGQR